MAPVPPPSGYAGGKIPHVSVKWRETTGVIICDKKVAVKLKVKKIYQTVIKPTMLYGAICWPMRNKEEHNYIK